MTFLSQQRPLSAGAFLEDGASTIDPLPHLWGFGGLHGGLLLGRAVAAIQREVGSASIRSVSGQYHRSTRASGELSVELTRTGRQVLTAGARLVDGAGVTMTATAIAAAARAAAPAATAPDTAPTNAISPDAISRDAISADAAAEDERGILGPVAPDAPAPAACPIFTVPPAFAPSAAQVELRPVGQARPFAGGDEPALTAWIRLVEDDQAPDLPRLVFLLDSLAPAQSAVLTTPALLPTVELTVHPSPELAHSRSPWVLLAARSTAVSSSGWLTERIDAWGLDGTHLATAHQLRLLRPA